MGIFVTNRTNHSPRSKGTHEGNHCHAGRKKDDKANPQFDRAVVAIYHLCANVRGNHAAVEEDVDFGSQNQRQEDHVARKALRGVVSQILSVGLGPSHMLAPDVFLVDRHEKLGRVEQA